MLSDNRIVKRIVFTGGPGGGKTTALAHAKEKLEARGICVLMIPEVPSVLFDSGIEIGERGLSLIDFEIQVFRMQLEKEIRYAEIAQRIQRKMCVVICDRGIGDIQAYMTPEQKQQMCEKLGTDIFTKIQNMLPERYDAVFHIDTAAIDAPSHYKMTPTRKESVEKARLLDTSIKAGWASHPNIVTIPGGDSFEKKLEHLLQEIESFIAPFLTQLS